VVSESFRVACSVIAPWVPVQEVVLIGHVVALGFRQGGVGVRTGGRGRLCLATTIWSRYRQSLIRRSVNSFRVFRHGCQVMPVRIRVLGELTTKTYVAAWSLGQEQMANGLCINMARVK
jgi:hypothetical protein